MFSSELHNGVPWFACFGIDAQVSGFRFNQVQDVPCHLSVTLATTCFVLSHPEMCKVGLTHVLGLRQTALFSVAAILPKSMLNGA